MFRVLIEHSMQVFILKPSDGVAAQCIQQEQEKKGRLKGLEAHKANIVAAKSVARLMRSSMGPKGMDKMMQSPDGDILISESTE